AKMIMRHISEGVELARKAGLPDSFIRIIEEHHGTSVILSTYYRHLQNNPNTGASDEELFRYPGRKPSSKESTIIMIADSFEAAARSLEGTSMIALRELVDKIVSAKMHDGQFADSPITLDELTTICETMVKTLY
ncbi:HD domain-containing protein, partial [Francisella tularensis]